MKRHRWYASKTMQGFFCSDCSRHVYEREASECLVAVHPDPAINKLYRERRKAAEAADGSGGSASRGWADLERIGRELAKLDPKGDWYYEGNHYDGLGWRVVRPEQKVVKRTQLHRFPGWTVREYALGQFDAAQVNGPAVSPGFDSFIQAVAWVREQDSTWKKQATDPAGLPKSPTGSAGTSPTDTPNEGAYMARKTATTSTKTAAAPKAEAVQFQPLLIAALKAEGIKPEVRVAPKGNYSSLLLDGVNIAYLDKQTSKGMKVIAAGQPGELKNGFVSSKRSGKFGAQLLVTKEAELAKAVAGLKLVVEGLAAAKAEKAAAPKPEPKTRQPKAEADSPAVTPNAVVLAEGTAVEAEQAEVVA